MAGKREKGVGPSASVAPLASVRMTINWMRRLGTGTGFGRGDPCTQWPDFASVVGEERRWLFECGDLEPVPASLREAVRGPSA